jgi:hypothetical protein
VEEIFGETISLESRKLERNSRTTEKTKRGIEQAWENPQIDRENSVNKKYRSAGSILYRLITFYIILI